MHRLPQSSGVALVLLAALATPASPLEARRPGAGRVWYIDNTAAPDGDGSMVAPFDRLSRAERAADVGDTLYVFRGDGTARGLDGGIRLRPHQRLLGSGVALELPGDESLPAGEPPLLAATIGAAVTLADFAVVEGLALAGNGPAVVAGAGSVGVRLEHLRIEGRGPAAGVALERVRDAELEDVTVTSARVGVLLTATTGVTLRRCRIAGAGGADGAALKAMGPVGLLRLESTDLETQGGAAMAVEATAGEARVELERVSFGSPPDAPSPVSGLVVRAGGEAVATVVAGGLVLDRIAGEGVSLQAEGHARLRLELSGSGLLDEEAERPTTAISAVARQDGWLEIAARGNDLPGRETGLLLSANGHGRLRTELLANMIGSTGGARGVVVLLGDGADAALVLSKNRIGGQRAEAVYAVAASQTLLAVDAHDNDLASGTANGSSSYPTLLVETRDGSRGCLSLAGNRFADVSGGGPAVRLRQRGESELGLSGYEPVATGAAGGAAQRLSATNQLGRVEIESERELAAPAGLPCPAPVATPQPTVAANP